MHFIKKEMLMANKYICENVSFPYLSFALWERISSDQLLPVTVFCCYLRHLFIESLCHQCCASSSFLLLMTECNSLNWLAVFKRCVCICVCVGREGEGKGESRISFQICQSSQRSCFSAATDTEHVLQKWLVCVFFVLPPPSLPL